MSVKDEDVWLMAYSAHATGLYQSGSAEFVALIADAAVGEFRKRFPALDAHGVTRCALRQFNRGEQVDQPSGVPACGDWNCKRDHVSEELPR